MYNDATGMADQTDGSSARLCLEAIELIYKLGLRPTPKIYEIFYSYVDHSDSTLAPIISRASTKGRPLDDAEKRTLYEHNSGSSAPDEQLHSLSCRLDEGVSETSSILEHAVETTSTFCNSLGGTQKDLATLNDTANLAAIVADLISATQRMEREGSAVKRKLNEISCEVDSVKADLENVRVQSFSDSLTNTSNRRLFDRAFAAAVADAEKNGQDLCLCMVDADHFKVFNDRHGHRAGDSALKLIASVLKSEVRERDIVARYGGEEFAILLNGADLNTGLTISERIRSNQASKRLVNRGSGEKLGIVTVSIGVAQYAQGETVTSLLERADNCLYQAKKNGRNMVVSEKEMHAGAETSAEEYVCAG